ncbi:MAG: hypothetical protein KIT83_06125 [Bryobacterales bacterium]|nr:hypothetical protein [Bryobacterales bacterium]
MRPEVRMPLSWFTRLLAGSISTCLLSPALLCEPPKRPEIIGHYGALRYGADEGWDGSSAAYGGTVTIPFARRWAVEADLATGQQVDFDSQGFGRRTRRIIVSGHIQYRRGTERAYWFVGFGPGLQYKSNSGRHLVQQSSDPEPVVRHFSSTGNEFAPIGYKTGVVVNPTRSLLIRGEVLMQHAYILPNAMFRIGVGWRF